MLADGDCLAVEGPSGSGKTRLLRVVADLEPQPLRVGRTRDHQHPTTRRAVPHRVVDQVDHDLLQSRLIGHRNQRAVAMNLLSLYGGTRRTHQPNPVVGEVDSLQAARDFEQQAPHRKFGANARG